MTLPNKSVYIDKDHSLTAEDLTSVHDCDQTIIFLTEQIVGIEAAEANTHAARLALKLRRLGLQRVNERRAALRKDHLLEIVFRLNPEVVREARSMAA